METLDLGTTLSELLSVTCPDDRAHEQNSPWPRTPRLHRCRRFLLAGLPGPGRQHRPLRNHPAREEVVERRYESSTPTAEGEPIRAAWQETVPEELGRHAEGAPVQTIDELYAACATNVLTQNPARNAITLEFRSDGILHRCLYVPKTCADDCEMGVRIDSITFGGAAEAPN